MATSLISPSTYPEYEKLCPLMPISEYEELKQSIKDDGLWYPIIINPSGKILDGHHRYRACHELGITPSFDVKTFKDPLDEKAFVINSNLRRKHLQPFQRAEMGKVLMLIESERAKQRQLSELTHVKDTLSLGSNEPDDECGRARDIVAKKVSLSPTTFQRALTCIEQASDEDKEALRLGEKSISTVYSDLVDAKRIQELEQKITSLPPSLEGTYEVIVIDPPWPYGSSYNIDGHRSASPYPEIPLDEIKNIKLPLANNSIVWLWTTNAFIHEAFHVLEAWGLAPKTILTWVKDRIGLGDWLRGQTEHCILAVKGSPLIKLTNQSTVLYGKSREHSRKPDEFYSLVDSFCVGRKLDYFSREPRTGWDVYGTNELT